MCEIWQPPASAGEGEAARGLPERVVHERSSGPEADAAREARRPAGPRRQRAVHGHGVHAVVVRTEDEAELLVAERGRGGFLGSGRTWTTRGEGEKGGDVPSVSGYSPSF